MSYKPEPIPFQGYSGAEHIPVDQVDQEDAAALQLQNNAYPGSLDHRSNADKEGVALDRSTSAGILTGKRTIEPLPETTRSGIDRSRSAGTTLMSYRVTEPSLETTRSGIDGCTKVNRPLSCPDVDHDSESVVVEEPEGPALHSDTGHPANASVGNGVRRSSHTTTKQSTARHASQACNNSDQLPISSSENAEEQGDMDWSLVKPANPIKISSGGNPSKRRKK